MTEAAPELPAPGGSDVAWSELVREVSADGRYFFTENQLYLAYARNRVQVMRYIARRGVIGLVMVIIGLATWIYALKVDWGITLVLGIAVTLTGVALVGTGVVTRRDPAPREPVRDWTLAHPPSQLLREPTLERETVDCVPARPRCVIVVQRDLVADLLLRNGAHDELGAFIVSESGYPKALTGEARRWLEAHPESSPIALHDATEAGVAMPLRLQKNQHLPIAGRSVVDAGLFPADVTWLAELAPAIPAQHTARVPVDSLTYESLVLGLRGVIAGALSIYAALAADAGPG